MHWPLLGGLLFLACAGDPTAAGTTALDAGAEAGGAPGNDSEAGLLPSPHDAGLQDGARDGSLPFPGDVSDGSPSGEDAGDGSTHTGDGGGDAEMRADGDAEAMVPDGDAGDAALPDPGDAASSAWTFTMGSGGIIEGAVAMSAGDRFVLSWSAGASLPWNVHRHEGEVIYEEQGVTDSGVLDFVAPADGTYWIMWENDTAASVDLDVSLTVYAGDFQGWL